MSLSIVFFFYILSYNSPACTCDGLKSNEDIDTMVRDADVIFIGTMSEYCDEQSVLFKVDTRYKGDSGDRLTISQTTACDMHYKKGQKYLIFGDLNNLTVETNLCRSFVVHPELARTNKMIHWLSQRNK